MKRLLREPLVHFLAAGALLFVYYGFAGGGDKPDDARIVVGAAQIERIQDAWSKQWRRLPTEAELQGLIEEFIQEEVLYREALALGLEADDSIIRRRLAQKMRFLIQDIADQNRPEQVELLAFFEERREQFQSPAFISFTHVYFNPDQRGADAAHDARRVLDGLNASGVTRAPEHGDLFMLHRDYVEISQQEASRLFGREFAESVFALRPGSWQGPIRSGYGIHLVRVSAYVPARMPEFAEVEERVRLEYMESQRRKANEAAIEGLKARYRITVDLEAAKRAGSAATPRTPAGDAS